MKRIGILTAGGDTPALNATIYGAVERANALKIEILGLQRGYAGLLDSRVPHVHLNPLFTAIPELDPCKGGTLLGSSRTYLDARSTDRLELVAKHVRQLKLDGLLCDPPGSAPHRSRCDLGFEIGLAGLIHNSGDRRRTVEGGRMQHAKKQKWRNQKGDTLKHGHRFILKLKARRGPKKLPTHERL